MFLANESVPADSSGDHSFGHNYDSCGCFKVAGEVTGDDHQLFYQEMDVCVMDKIMSIDINVQDENGRIMGECRLTFLSENVTEIIEVVHIDRLPNSTFTINLLHV